MPAEGRKIPKVLNTEQPPRVETPTPVESAILRNIFEELSTKEIADDGKDINNQRHLPRYIKQDEAKMPTHNTCANKKNKNIDTGDYVIMH